LIKRSRKFTVKRILNKLNKTGVSYDSMISYLHFVYKPNTICLIKTWLRQIGQT